jgi:Tol biopolymer transport system component/tRNA A-37 threonylcarbamoyl transferase component Bud32
MSLNRGDRLGHYEIIALLGRGGMGEVYRARDPRLARDVAIKILHSNVTGDPERRSRFELEARAAGGLSHPNVIAVFDIGSEDGAMYVVQELLEGETLRDRLQSGALQLRKALDYATQASKGLAAAHAKGIVHRDLKPENLFLTKDGRLKILDFGLAKLTETSAMAAHSTEVATQTIATQPGTVMGTVGYMSPEQVRGEAVDHRTDIFALGAVLFEMVTGRRAFQGASPADTISAILKEDPPDVSTINQSLPPALDRLVRHALEKNPGERFHSAQDFAWEMETLAALPSGSIPARGAGKRPRGLPLMAVGLAAAALVAGAFIGRTFWRSRGPDLAAYRLSILAGEQGGKAFPAWSPDGKTIAYSANVDGVVQIMTRSLDQPVPVQLTHSNTDCTSPFWSPDSARIFYLSGRNLFRIGAAGGTPEVEARDILAAHISPDGKALVVARRDASGASIWVQTPGSSAEGRKLAGISGSGAETPFLQFAPDGTSIGASEGIGSGNFVFWLISYPGGEVRRVTQALSTERFGGAMVFSWFPDNRHVVLSAALSRAGRDHLLVADVRDGKTKPLTPAFNDEAQPSLSPDGRRLAFTLLNSDSDLVEIPLDGAPVRTVLATSAPEHCAAWSPKGDQFVYSKEHNGADEVWLYNVREHWERPLVTPASFKDANTDRVSEARISPDGQRVVFSRVSGGKYSLWLTNVLGGVPVPMGIDGLVPVWSPDGEWIAYQTLERGQFGLAKVSAGGGKPIVLKPPAPPLTRTQWSPDSRWLTFHDNEGLKIVSADGSKTELLSAEEGWLAAAGFTRTGNEVVGLRRNENHHVIIEAIDIRTKRSRMIGDIGPQQGAHGFSLAPDGKSFLTTLELYRGDIAILEGYENP